MLDNGKGAAAIRHFGIGRILRAVSAHCARAPHVASQSTHMLTRGRIYLHVEEFIYTWIILLRLQLLSSVRERTCALFRNA